MFSFDVFDTCLARLCGEPRLLFDVLSLKVQKAIGEDCSEYLRELFVVARTEASGYSLEEIYENVAERFPLPYSTQQMAQLELDTEREMLVPINDTKLLVEKLRQKGKILFISDMYLPSSFIREQLVKHGFFKEGDGIYVSDELKAWKRDGSLFKLVHDREKISYRQWHHYGDNRQSDYNVPRKLGIHAHHLHYDYLHYEEWWRDIPVLQCQSPSILAGVSRAVRLQSEATESQKAFVCDITAPTMCFWVLKVMYDARAKGLKRLYFCARDAHTHYLIARELHDIFPDIEVKYLFISRMALYESPLIKDYLISVGFMDNTPKAIVDMTTSGKTLSVLNQVLMDNGSSPIKGYFWQWTAKELEKTIMKNGFNVDYEIMGLYLGLMTRRKTKRLVGMVGFFEPFCSFNLHSKTIGYEYHGSFVRPIFGDDSKYGEDWVCVNNSHRIVKRNNDKTAVMYTDAIKKTGLIEHALDLYSNISIPTLADFVSYPRKEYVEYLRCFLWWGQPFVGRMLGLNKGVWKRGNWAYSLPRLILNSVYQLLPSPGRRRKLNQMLSWIR